MMRRARSDAAALKESLKVQGPSARPNFDAGAARDAALKNPKILELLGVDGEKEAEIARSEGYGDAWTQTKGFLFASFSLPPQALRDLMLGAEEMGLPVLFRGFHKNSVFETNDALMEVFGNPEDIKGFSIDPTLFTQFEVNAVPTLIVLKDPYTMCETQACAGDAAPVHDRLAGTITVKSALELIKRGNGDASVTASALLEQVKP
jgi:type-F conjugative transfer system pilin assembly protein TrbC